MAMNGGRWQRRRAKAGYAVLLFLLMVSFAAMLQGQENASPGEDHVAIAARYRQEAAETRETSKRHQLSRDVYRRGLESPYTVMNPQGRERMVQHCDRLIEHYTKAVQELEAMAEEHAVLAKQLQETPLRR